MSNNHGFGTGFVLNPSGEKDFVYYVVSLGWLDPSVFPNVFQFIAMNQKNRIQPWSHPVRSSTVFPLSPAGLKLNPCPPFIPDTVIHC